MAHTRRPITNRSAERGSRAGAKRQNREGHKGEHRERQKHDGYAPSKRASRELLRGDKRYPAKTSRPRSQPPHRMPERHDESLIKYVGLRACLALLEKRPRAIRRVFITEAQLPAARDLVAWCGRTRVPCKTVDAIEIERISATDHHEGICIEAEIKKPLPVAEFDAFLLRRRSALVLYLENVENPHNVGAILRTAGFFGVDGVVLSSKTLRNLSGSLCRIAEGAVEHLPICIVEDPGEILGLLLEGGFVAVGTTPHRAAPLYTFKWPEKCLVMFGAEGSGLSNEALGRCEASLTIPRFGPMESLNVGAAVAAVLVESRRGRLFKNTPRAS